MKSLEKKFPHTIKLGRRNSALGNVNLSQMADAMGIGRPQLLTLLKSGTKRISLTVAERLSSAIGCGCELKDAEEFVNMAAAEQKRLNTANVGVGVGVGVGSGKDENSGVAFE